MGWHEWIHSCSISLNALAFGNASKSLDGKPENRIGIAYLVSLKHIQQRNDNSQFIRFHHVGKDKREHLPSTCACDSNAVYAKVECFGNV